MENYKSNTYEGKICTDFTEGDIWECLCSNIHFVYNPILILHVVESIQSHNDVIGFRASGFVLWDVDKIDRINVLEK